MRTNHLYCLHYIILSSKMLCKNGNSISAIQRVWNYPKIQKQSVSAVSRNALFFRCGYSPDLLVTTSPARKTQYWHQQNEPERIAEFQVVRSGFRCSDWRSQNISKSFLSVFEVKGCSWLLRGLSLFKPSTSRRGV